MRRRLLRSHSIGEQAVLVPTIPSLPPLLARIYAWFVVGADMHVEEFLKVNRDRFLADQPRDLHAIEDLAPVVGDRIAVRPVGQVAAEVRRNVSAELGVDALSRAVARLRADHLAAVERVRSATRIATELEELIRRARPPRLRLPRPPGLARHAVERTVFWGAEVAAVYFPIASALGVDPTNLSELRTQPHVALLAGCMSFAGTAALFFAVARGLDTFRLARRAPTRKERNGRRAKAVLWLGFGAAGSLFLGQLREALARALATAGGAGAAPSPGHWTLGWSVLTLAVPAMLWFRRRALRRPRRAARKIAEAGFAAAVVAESARQDRVARAAAARGAAAAAELDAANLRGDLDEALQAERRAREELEARVEAAGRWVGALSRVAAVLRWAYLAEATRAGAHHLVKAKEVAP